MIAANVVSKQGDYTLDEASLQASYVQAPSSKEGMIATEVEIGVTTDPEVEKQTVKQAGKSDKQASDCQISRQVLELYLVTNIYSL